MHAPISPGPRRDPFRLAAALRIFAVGILLAAASPARAELPGPADFVGHWEGEITLPAISIPIMIDLVYESERWSGTIDIPQQGTKGMKLDRIWLESPVLHFAIPNVPGDPVFEGVLAEGKITGTLRQSGHETAFHLIRGDVAGLARPQEPKPPFPYRIEEVAYPNGDVRLAGTLTLPPGDGPFPAVLLSTGSGAQNRDEEIFGHKPFLVLADALTRSGIAVLRVDDRGVGGSGGTAAEATTSDFADDALAGIRFLKDRREIDPKRVGVIGHSEGALVGLLAATRSKEVRFLVFLAGPGVPGSEVLQLQINRMDRARGLAEPLLEAEQQIIGAALAAASAEADSTAIRLLIEAEADRFATGLPDSLQATMSGVRRALLGLGRGLTTPWFRHFLRYDPRPDLRQVKIPVLALNGEKDLQVSADQNLPAIEQALADGGNHNVTVRRLPGLNHLFQPATTGLPEEYGAIPITFDPSAIEAIRGWITERFGKR